MKTVEEKRSRWQAFWALVGQISTLVAVLGGLMGLFNFAVKPKTKIMATATPNKIILPSSAMDPVRVELLNASDLDEIFREVMNSTSDGNSMVRHHGKSVDWVKERILAHVEAKNMQRPSFDSKRIGGSWEIRVYNSGDLPAEDVVLRVADVIEAKVKRDDDKEEIVDKEVMALGRIRPKESIEVTAWTSSMYSWSIRDLSLTHDTGIGEIELDLPYAEASKSTLWVLVAALPSVIILLFFRLRPREILGPFRRRRVEASPQE